MTLWRGVLLGWAALAVAQSQVPVLRSTADIIVVDAQVTSPSGDVISDLTQSDFTLTIDGKPRPILNFIHESSADLPAAKRAGTGGMSTLSSGVNMEARSWVIVVVEPWSMWPDTSRSLLDQAADFVENLPAAHAVAMKTEPSGRYPFSTNRKPIVAALRKMLGGLSPGMPLPPGSAGLVEEAIDDLRDVEGRKTIVFIIDVLRDSNENLRYMAERAAEANVTIHTISTDNTVQALVDVRKRLPEDLPLLAASSAAVVLSDMTGGFTIRRAAAGSIVMPRIAALLAEQYVLSFGVTRSDKDGKPHRIDVSVNRSGAVRARSSFVR